MLERIPDSRCTRESLPRCAAFPISFATVLFAYFCVGEVDALRGALMRKAAANQGLSVNDIVEDIDNDEVNYDLFTGYRSITKESIFHQGESLDFLHFLRKIQYDHRQLPENHDGGSVDIHVSIVVSSIRAVSEVTMDYNLELFYRESWLDKRLVYDKRNFQNKTEIALHESYTNFIWHPDTFMPNAIASKNPQKQSISHRSLLRLQDSGNVLYSRRLSVIAECPMDLTLFPFDTQVCKLAIESYGYTAEKVKYSWSSGSKKALKLHKIRLPDFQIREAYVTSHTGVYATGNYSRLYVCFVLSRSAGFCFLQLIIPSTAIVITSWVSLWMENETSFQDMISIILTITFLLFSYNEVMPRVSYIKAMDVYLGVCFCIVFFSLIKLALVKYMRERLRITRDTSIVAGLMPVIQLGTGGIRHRPQLSAPSAPVVIESNGVQKVNTNSGSTYTAIHMGSSSPIPLNTSIDKFTSHESVNGNASLKSKSRIRFTPRFMQRFHWMTQMCFLFGFVVFCLFYFLIYPNVHTTTIDAACIRESAEWFAVIL